MRLKRMHWFGIISFIVIVIFSLVYYILNKDLNLFLFILGIGLCILFLPFVVQLTLESKNEEEVVEWFLEFSRNLAESVAIGTPISKSIVSLANRDYGYLTPNIKKLANQILIGIPVGKALENFAFDLRNPV